MSLGAILLIVLIIALLGGFSGVQAVHSMEPAITVGWIRAGNCHTIDIGLMLGKL